MTKKHLVSVVMPVYNAVNYIAEAIESILSQSYDSLELVIVDDGSTDGTTKVIDEYREDNRVSVHVHEKNKGLAPAYNTGFTYCRGEFIAILDADDVSFNYRIEKEVNALVTHPECGFVFAPAYRVDLQGRKLDVFGDPIMQEGVYPRREFFEKIYVEGNIIPNTTVMFRKQQALATRYDESLQLCNDFLFNLLLAHENNVYYISEALGTVRRGSGHISMTSRRERNFEAERTILRKVYHQFKNDQTFCVPNKMYRRALATQLLKEAYYYHERNVKAKEFWCLCVVLSLGVCWKRTLELFISNFVSVKLYMFIVNIKNALLGDRK